MSNEQVVVEKPEFNKFRAAVWPIHGYEMKKFLPMSLMMFCILFVYTMVRDLKDTLITTVANCGGAECIPKIKLYGVLPVAFIAIVIFAKLVNKFDMQKVFYIVVGFFLTFYALFGFVIYPVSDYIHASEETIRGWQASMPSFFYWLLPLVGNWSYSLFYILSELWGSLVISSLFWQFANQTTMKSEVKRFYGLFACIGNVGLICSGSLVRYLSEMAHKAVKQGDMDAFTKDVKWQMIYVLLIGAVLVFLYTYINKCVLTDPRFYDPTQVKGKKEKPKMGIGESFKCIVKSPYLLLITILVMGYGIAINLAEVVWKSQGKILFPESHQFNNMMASLSILTGVITIIVTLTGSNILRKCKWRTAALITPISVLILGSIFFGIVIYENHAGLDAKILGMNVVWLAVYFGLIQDALSKGIKYALFDSTKQMAYIPLDTDLKTKGQAAVEVIGGRLGKAGGSAISDTLTSFIFIGSTLTSLAGIIAPISIAIVLAWTGSVCKLSGKYEALVAKKASADNSNEVKEENKEKVTVSE